MKFLFLFSSFASRQAEGLSTPRPAPNPPTKHPLPTSGKEKRTSWRTVEVCVGGVRASQCSQVRRVRWVSKERSAAAAWPRSHSSQAGGGGGGCSSGGGGGMGGIDRPVIKSGALVGAVCGPLFPPGKARGCCLLSPICIIQRHRSSRRKGAPFRDPLALVLFC